MIQCTAQMQVKIFCSILHSLAARTDPHQLTILVANPRKSIEVPKKNDLYVFMFLSVIDKRTANHKCCILIYINYIRILFLLLGRYLSQDHLKFFYAYVTAVSSVIEDTIVQLCHLIFITRKHL